MSSLARALSGLFVIAVVVAGCGEDAAPTSAEPAAAAHAESPAPAAAPAAMPVAAEGAKIASDRTFLDLGDMLLGAERTVAFPIRNDGTQPLVIRRIETTCGCTFARILDAKGDVIESATSASSGTVHTLTPGAACSVELHFVSAGQPATRLRKQTRVVTNDPIQSELVLEIEVNLIKAFTLDPQSIVFGEIVRGNTVTKTVRVVPDETMAAVELLGFADVPPYVEPTLARVGDHFEVALTIRGDAPIGYLQPTLHLTTSDATFPRIPVQFAITVKSPVVIDTGDASQREILDFGPIAAGSKHERTIRVENGAREAVNLVEVRVDSKRADSVSTAIEVGVPGRSYRVKVTLVAPADAKSVRGSLVLKSDSALMPDKIVPFQAWVTKPADAAPAPAGDGDK
ncbi:MAG: DUF1573 domain-containing protein [Planctomycetes bacterium]|nr:DUF1573 domain-containing protein [Planctomycetota bacterium]